MPIEDRGDAPDTTAPDASAAAEKEWWEEDGLPWTSKPTKADYWCLAWFGFAGLFGLAMIPLRAWLLGLDPPIQLALTGSRFGAASTGALAAVGQVGHWLAYLLVGSLVAIKFDWIYWWAGKLWGRGILEVQAGQSRRTARNIERAERWAVRLGWIGIFLAYVPIPLPIALVVFVLAGMTDMPLWRFMLLNFVAKTLWSLGYFALGWWIGEPVVYVLEQYARVASWIAIGLLVIVFAGIFRNRSRKGGARAAGG